MRRDPNNPADFDHAALLSFVEDESDGVPIPEDVRRRIDADPELRAAYDELKESVRVLRALPLRCAPPDVWGKLADAYERELGAGRDVAAGHPRFTPAAGPVRSRPVARRVTFRIAAAAALLVAAGWAAVAFLGGDDEWRAPNGLEFVAVDAARVTGISGVPAASIPPEMAVLGFMTRTQIRLVPGGGSSGGASSGAAPVATSEVASEVATTGAPDAR